jgi:hypothetical protein
MSLCNVTAVNYRLQECARNGNTDFVKIVIFRALTLCSHVDCSQ